MKIRDQKEDGTFRDEFYETASSYEKKPDYTAGNTVLPDEPDLTMVQMKIREIEEKEHVKVLHAVGSGSRKAGKKEDGNDRNSDWEN